jgi:outer membrane protein assembly factor BamC
VTRTFLMMPRAWATRLTLLAAVTACAAGCSTIESIASGDKVDYRSGGTKTAGLDVPPDLTQLSRDSRYTQAGGAVSAAAFQAGTAGAAATGATGAGTVAPVPTDQLRIERLGDKRWLVTALTPEQLWPQLQAFWKDRGLTLVRDQPDAGVMETEWAENRAKLPQDPLRATLGRLLDGLYSTGERDKFRTRVERTRAGTEVYITHRGMVEVYSTQLRDATMWQPRPADPELEAELLSRLMVKLGVKEEQARTAVAAPVPTQAPRARVLAGRPAATLQLDDGFDRAWRRVGVTLDRSGFTVEDRDRSQGLYFVRYIDASKAAKEEPGFLSRLFSRDADGPAGPVRYRVFVKAEGEATLVSVLGSQGNPDNGDNAQRIIAILVDDLK